MQRSVRLLTPKRLHKRNGHVIHLWCSQDALVLKVMAMLLEETLTIAPACTHVKGHGGLKQCVVNVQQRIKDYRYVCKTDVKHFYESINHSILLQQIHAQVGNNILTHYLYQVIHRTVEFGGHYTDINKGISRGCPISPILGALYLKSLDDAFNKEGLYYVRYMDDILILTKTRWHNRKVVRLLNQEFNKLKVEQHPDKTFIGRIERGFDFLGYHFSRKSLKVAKETVRRHLLHFRKLYEQLRTKKATSNEMALILGDYVTRWQCWCNSGLQSVRLCDDVLNRTQVTPSR